MIRILGWLVALLLLGTPLWLALLALESAPRVSHAASLSVDDIENAQRLLRQNDPRQLREGERRRVVLTQRELNLMLRYALPEGSAARVAVRPELMSIAASTHLPRSPLGEFLNAEVLLAQREEHLEPIAIGLGRITLPAWISAGIARLGDQLLRSQLPEYRLALGALEAIRAQQGRLEVRYRWRGELLEQLRDRGRALILPDTQRRRVLAYYGTIAALAGELPPGASLVGLLRPLFATAAARSRAGADPAEENRAAILALGMAMRGTDPDRLRAGTDAAVARLRSLAVTLGGRRDLAQHFVISAAIAAGGGSRLADAVGVFKELSDSRGGSGFSFPDLLADRAGVVFAERATGARAGQIQGRLAGAAGETLFMPSIAELPEGLQDPEFRRRYEDVDTTAYNRVRDLVERRIRQLPLYR